MIKKTGKSIIAFIMAVIMLAAPAYADFIITAPESAEEESTTEKGAAEHTGTFSIQSEEMLLRDMGLTWMEWNDEISAIKKQAAAHPVKIEDVKKADPQAQITEKDGMVRMILAQLPLTVNSPRDACDALYRLIRSLGRDENTEMVFMSQLNTEKFDIYLFQEIFEGQTVLASTVKLVADKEGQLKAVFSSLADSLPETCGTPQADAEGAADSVKKYLEQQNINANVFEEYTGRIFIAPEADPDDEEQAGLMADELVPDRLLWVVYSENPDPDRDYPYLAHYTASDGTYLYNQKVKQLRDEAGQSGYDAAYLFDKMEADEWTGEIELLDGTVQTITVPVMKGKSSGKYYLGDVRRRIVIAQFHEYVYEDEFLAPVTSEENEGWDNSDLIAYSYFIKVWDYYARMGWNGPDGCGTPVLLLKDMQLEDGMPLDNAAYGGKYTGWQIFAYDNSFYHVAEGLDVWAHEYGHGITTTVQGVNLYENDMGAINESFSDILGNLCQITLKEQTEDIWELGEDTAYTFRSMSDPHLYGQPEYVWDIYYAPHTDRPNDVNDRGGVHSNSSLLNLLAAKLCEEGAMNLETAEDFWMTVIFVMNGAADFPEMADVLMWTAQEAGYSDYTETVERLIGEGQLRRTAIPEDIEDGRTLVSLTLPDTETMRDENWALLAFQLRTELLKELPERLLSAFLQEDEDSADAIIEDLLMNVVRQQTSYASDENLVINMMQEDRPTLYVLLNMDPKTMEVLSLLVLSGDSWLDLTALVARSQDDDSEDSLPGMITKIVLGAGKQLLTFLFNIGNMDGLDRSGNHVTLTANGLESAVLPGVR